MIEAVWSPRHQLLICNLGQDNSAQRSWGNSSAVDLSLARGMPGSRPDIYRQRWRCRQLLYFPTIAVWWEDEAAGGDTLPGTLAISPFPSKMLRVHRCQEEMNIPPWSGNGQDLLRAGPVVDSVAAQSLVDEFQCQRTWQYDGRRLEIPGQVVMIIINRISVRIFSVISDIKNKRSSLRTKIFNWLKQWKIPEVGGLQVLLKPPGPVPLIVSVLPHYTCQLCSQDWQTAVLQVTLRESSSCP